MRNLATLAVAVFLGLIAVILVRNYLGRQIQGPSAEAATIPVVVAAQQIARGAALQAAMLKVVVFPRESLPAGTFPDVAQVTGAKEGPRVAMRAFLPNEPLLTGNVSPPGGRPNLSEALTPGMRAVSFRSGDVAGVGGFVLPGDRVDVLLTRAMTAGERNEQVTQVLADNIRVLGVDQSDDNQATKPVVTRTVTLEVLPDQAEAISLGESVGQVSLALRQTADGMPLTRRAFTVDDLTAEIPKKKTAPVQVAREVRRPAPPVVAAPPPPPQTVVRVVRGVDATYYAGTETSLTAVAGRAPPPAAVPIPPATVRP